MKKPTRALSRPASSRTSSWCRETSSRFPWRNWRTSPRSLPSLAGSACISLRTCSWATSSNDDVEIGGAGERDSRYRSDQRAEDGHRGGHRRESLRPLRLRLAGPSLDSALFRHRKCLARTGTRWAQWNWHYLVRVGDAIPGSTVDRSEQFRHGHQRADGGVRGGTHSGARTPERKFLRPRQEPLSRGGHGQVVHLAEIQKRVQVRVGHRVEEAARGVLLQVGDELEEVVAAPALSIALHLDAHHVRGAALPEEIDAAVLEARIELHVVDEGAGRAPLEVGARELYGAFRRAEHPSHRVAAPHLPAELDSGCDELHLAGLAVLS